jgi:hypothetical protein
MMMHSPLNMFGTILAQTSTPSGSSSSSVGMPHFDAGLLEVILYSIAGIALLVAGYRLGRLIGRRSATRALAQKEQELFTAQKGFKNLYEQELATVRAESEQLKARAEQMNIKVEEYRKKAAGLGRLVQLRRQEGGRDVRPSAGK